MFQAYEIGKELFAKYADRVLLHGDLHHHNILLDSSGRYKIIDPKGVTGPSIFDLPRFVLNELDLKINVTGEEHIKYVINRLSELLGYEKKDIDKLFFMEVILANVWCLEDGEEINEQDINIAVNVLEKSY